MEDREALSTAYRDIVAAVRDIGAEEEWLPTGCAGWSVRDLIFHLRGDAQRALVALASPAGTAPDTDAVSYWTHWRPDTEGAALNRRMTRISASVYSGLRPILDSYVETTEAVVYAAVQTDPGFAVRTQGHVMRAGDLVRTLVVEAAIHHLDLVVALDRPLPSAGPLRLVRETLDGLLGEPLPLSWDDVAYARAGTGRTPLSAADRTALGPLAGRFPLFG
ncbi:maleylpyruvate isomerase N-terminal domain-containing protein [Actinomadura sp. DC4]|uniref:maleylpyruvate isomerase N-terminal domain-containing protein n=1 Tax=Actinomadura sp. DC4 TaxID=3055069 RepID=UPI0025B0E339|nr:maleylpyruvate isomerase N-terminal domain-containing protein [Actinomadura sp. DC4]MDN3357955.1 maleylpyruvate isomerase N-terminal domain-containing protein [Actinomadura sp. DC4]